MQKQNGLEAGERSREAIKRARVEQIKVAQTRLADRLIAEKRDRSENLDKDERPGRTTTIKTNKHRKRMFPSSFRLATEER